MTRNPYAQMGNVNDPGQPAGYGGPGDFNNDRPPRTSMLAVASLIVSIISLVICCIPGPGILGMLLALGAVISISSSGGRRTGLGMAIAGLVLGLVSTVIAVVIWLAVAAGLGSLAGHRTTMEAIWQRDAVAAASAFEPAAAAQITPERLEAFVQEVESELGAYKSIPQGVGGFWVGYGRIQYGAPAFQILGQQGYTGQAVPVPAEFDNGYATLLLELVPGASVGPGPTPGLRNLGIALPSNRIVWLIDAAAAPTTTTPPPALPPGTTPPATPPDAPDGNTDAPVFPDEPEPVEPTQPPTSPTPPNPSTPPTAPEQPGGG